MLKIQVNCIMLFMTGLYKFLLNWRTIRFISFSCTCIYHLVRAGSVGLRQQVAFSAICASLVMFSCEL